MFSTAPSLLPSVTSPGFNANLLYSTLLDSQRQHPQVRLMNTLCDMLVLVLKATNWNDSNAIARGRTNHFSKAFSRPGIFGWLFLVYGFQFRSTFQSYRPVSQRCIVRMVFTVSVSLLAERDCYLELWPTNLPRYGHDESPYQIFTTFSSKVIVQTDRQTHTVTHTHTHTHSRVSCRHSPINQCID